MGSFEQHTKRRVPSKLSGRHNQNSELANNVFLIGFMGAGKSTIARRLARTYGITSLDMDMYIERKQNKTIADIFKDEGEEAFRAIETETLRELAAAEELKLISCGGGVILSEENRRLLKDHGFTVHLLVDADEAASRIADKSSRPLFNDLEQARKRAQDRLPLYRAAAHAEVATSGKRPPEIASEVARLLKEHDVLRTHR